MICSLDVMWWTAQMSRRLIVVVQSPLLYRVVGRNGEATFPRDPIILNRLT